MLADVDVFLAQTSQDASRLEAVGAPAERIQVSGNLKFDVALPDVPVIVGTLRTALRNSGAGPVLVCGSTVEGEETIVLKAFENVLAAHPRALMILAPRHPERFEAVAALLQQAGVKWVRRTQLENQTGKLIAGVLLLDTIGELAAIYGLADLAFVGGSLVPRGGHNIIEPALHGVAIVVGDHTENFRDIVRLFQKHEAVRIVRPMELSRVFTELLANHAERIRLGHCAAEVVKSQIGATLRTLNALTTLLADHRDAVVSSAQAAHTH
jgi:3-deoxy-D-manno-octulosonic-acid transferase